LRPGGRLVLAHHRVDYPDFVQHADAIHKNFLIGSRASWTSTGNVRTGRWLVQSYVRR
jgi:hypothetical protein